MEFLFDHKYDLKLFVMPYKHNQILLKILWDKFRTYKILRNALIHFSNFFGLIKTKKYVCIEFIFINT